MIKYVTYSLFWIDGVGKQPYEQVAAHGAVLDGGVATDNGRYFGYIEGTEDQCISAIDGCGMYGMKEMTEQESKIFLTTCAPVNLLIKTSGGLSVYLGEPKLNLKGKFERILHDVEQPIPAYQKPKTLEERVKDVETKVGLG